MHHGLSRILMTLNDTDITELIILALKTGHRSRHRVPLSASVNGGVMRGGRLYSKYPEKSMHFTRKRLLSIVWSFYTLGYLPTK